jgi:putative MATE family efflux protein
MRIPLVSRPLERRAQRQADSNTSLTSITPLATDHGASPQLPASQTLTQRALRRRVWALALPAIGEQVLALGVGLSDTFLSGHLSPAASAVLGYGRATAIAAVGVAVTIVWIVLTAFFAVNIGVTALVARATGARDRALASRGAGQGILLGFIAGTLMFVAALPLAELMTNALGVSGQVASLAAAFIRVYSLALPATGMASAATASMRGASDARRPLVVMVVVNGCNIIGSWILLNGIPSLGIAPLGVIGSAVGAATGWTCGAALALFLLTRRHPKAPHLSLPYLRPDLQLMRRILRVGLPSSAELVVFQMGIVSFLRLVVPLGATAYAANTAINSVESMGTLPGFGFSIATTALVGQALGAADPKLAVRVVGAALRPCVLVMGSIGLLAFLLPHIILGLFVADSQVLASGDIAMRLAIFTLPLSATAFVFIGALRGAGDTKFPVLVRASGTWGIRVPVALLLISHIGLPGARVAMAMDFATQAGVAYLRFRSGRWRRAKV